MKMELDSSQRCRGKGKRQWPQVATREIQKRCKEKLYHPENGAALDRAQRSGGISILGDFQNLTGRGPGQPD